MDLSEESQKLLEQLRELHFALRDHTHNQYNRINPFSEDMFQWKERGAYWVGEDRNISIYNSTTVVGDVTIGDNTWIGPFCSLDGTGKLRIGRWCSISLGCQLLTHDTVKHALSGGRAPYEYSPVDIGDCCFLGTHCIVLRGVTIGNHCLIGAGSIVTHDLPDYSIAIGSPARIVGQVVINLNGEVTFNYHKK